MRNSNQVFKPQYQGEFVNPQDADKPSNTPTRMQTIRRAAKQGAVKGLISGVLAGTGGVMATEGIGGGVGETISAVLGGALGAFAGPAAPIVAPIISGVISMTISAAASAGVAYYKSRDTSKTTNTEELKDPKDKETSHKISVPSSPLPTATVHPVVFYPYTTGATAPVMSSDTLDLHTRADNDDDEIPEATTCPLTKAIYLHPVSLPNGQTYEKKALLAFEALCKQHDRVFFCPVTSRPFPSVVVNTLPKNILMLAKLEKNFESNPLSKQAQFSEAQWGGLAQSIKQAHFSTHRQNSLRN